MGIIMPPAVWRKSLADAQSTRAPPMTRLSGAARQVSSPKSPVLEKSASFTQGWLRYDAVSVPLRERWRLCWKSTPPTRLRSWDRSQVLASRPPQVARSTSAAMAIGMALMRSGARSVKLSITWSA
ncbi:hypothetical protein D3C87_1581370 [compost metagenome]